MAAHPISRRKHAQVLKLAADGLSLRRIGKKVGIDSTTAMKYARLPLAGEPGPVASLPKSWAEDYPPFVIDAPARVLLLSDIHIPFHDAGAIEAVVEFGKQAGVNTVLLNGDTLDCHTVSRYDHDGSKLTYVEEVEAGRQFLRYLRGRFTKARIVFKDGNHEERLDKYILSRAPALFGLEDCTIASLIGLAAVGAEHVRDQRVIHAGQLRVIHGHEYGSGVHAPVSAARGYPRTRWRQCCGR